MSHLDPAEIIAWLARDTDGADAIEEHLFACDACAAEAERFASISETLRRMLPLTVDEAGLAALRARYVVTENTIAPEVESTVVFEPGVDLLVHRLTGLDLGGATRVDLNVSFIASGQHFMTNVGIRHTPDAVLLLCQRHFLELPPDTLMEVTVHRPDGATTTRYPIMHVVR